MLGTRLLGIDSTSMSPPTTARQFQPGRTVAARIARFAWLFNWPSAHLPQPFIFSIIPAFFFSFPITLPGAGVLCQLIVRMYVAVWMKPLHYYLQLFNGDSPSWHSRH